MGNRENTNRKRAARRKQRQKKHDRKREKLAQKIADATHKCPDCGDIWLEMAKVPMHRPGPCGATPEDVALMEIMKHNVKHGDECSNCDESPVDCMVIHVEAQCVWVGCQTCWPDNKMEVVKKLDRIRSSWRNRAEGTSRFIPPPMMHAQSPWTD